MNKKIIALLAVSTLVFVLISIISIVYLYSYQKPKNLASPASDTQTINPVVTVQKPYFDENDPTPTPVQVNKIDLAPVVTMSKEYEKAFIENENGIDTTDKEKVNISD